MPFDIEVYLIVPLTIHVESCPPHNTLGTIYKNLLQNNPDQAFPIPIITMIKLVSSDKDYEPNRLGKSLT